MTPIISNDDDDVAMDQDDDQIQGQDDGSEMVKDPIIVYMHYSSNDMEVINKSYSIVSTVRTLVLLSGFVRMKVAGSLCVLVRRRGTMGVSMLLQMILQKR